MQHPESDDLALLALGESLGAAVDAHVAGCAQCAAEIATFRTTVGLAELSNYGEDAPQPGEHVWQAIANELGFESARAGGGVATSVDASQPVSSVPPDGQASGLGSGRDGRDRRDGRDGSQGRNGAAVPPLRSVPDAGPDAADSDAGASDAAGPAAGDSRPGASPAVDSDSAESDAGFGADPPRVRAIGPARGASTRRWSRWAAPLAAAVVGIAVGAGAVVISQNRSDEVTVEAVAPLTPVLGGPLTADQQQQLGKAELVVAPTGQEVRVNAPELPPSPNDYEVWLFGGDGRMVSLGTLADGSGTFTVPQGISTTEYRVVDVSDEPPDGNPAHSGISLVRGSFS